MNKFIKHIVLIWVVLLSFSCARKSLGTDCECYTTALLPVSIDWSNLTQDPENVRLLVYNQADGALVKKFTYEHDASAAVQAYLPLSMGEYTVIVINEARGDLENMTIADEYDFSTTKFYVSSDTGGLYDAYDEDHLYLDELDELATHVVKNIVVTEDMSYANVSGFAMTKSSENYVSTDLMGLKPLRKDVEMEIKLQVEGMEYAKTPVLVDMLNVANGFIVSSETNTTDQYNMQFYMENNTKDDDDDENGITTLTSKVTMFGTLGDRFSLKYYEANNIDLQFVLRFEKVDGETETRIVNVTDLTFSEDNLSGIIKLQLGIALTDADSDDGNGGLTPAEPSDDEDEDEDDKTTIEPGTGSGVEDWKDNESELSGEVND